VWDVASGAPVETLSGHGGRITALTLSADGETLYTCSLDGAIFEWDLGASRRFGKPFTAGPSAEPEFGPDAQTIGPPLASSPDGRSFAVRVGASGVASYSTATLHRRNAFRVPGVVIGLAWSRTGDLAVTGDKGLVQLWRLGGHPHLVRELTGLRSTNKLTEAVTTAAFSPDGAIIAAGDVNHTAPSVPYRFGTVAAWDAASGRRLWKARSKDGAVTGLAFAPDGKTLAVARESGSIVFSDPRSGRVKRTQKVDGGLVTLTYAPDGTLATGTWSGIVQFWDAGTGAQIGHPTLVAAAPVASISFDPSGTVFATTGGSDGLAKLWTTKTQQQFGATFPGRPGMWGRAVHTPDGSKLLTVFADGTGFVWPTALRDLESHACAVAGRNFTREEWARYVSGYAYRETCP
jgi:WD40 repeat protein